jgi:hypothetical protein
MRFSALTDPGFFPFANAALVAPELMDVEVVAVLRRAHCCAGA